MECGVPFCQNGEMIAGMTSGCPLKNLIPETNDLVYIGNWKQAYERLVKTNCFPEFTGRVCPALCEASCTCGLNGEPVATKDNEKAIIEHAFENGWVKASVPKVRTGKKVAVIGSGPAGLSAAVQLNKRGHFVTVFERNDRVGGLLMYGIPNMKLDKKIIDRRIDILRDEGISFKTCVDVGKDVSADELKNSFDKIILACGASKPRDINVCGRESGNIYFAVEFLSSVTKSLLNSNFSDKNYISAKNKNVLVIGGGDTGNDCVATAVRLGAKTVVQLEIMPCPSETRRSDNPWPQWPKVLKTDYGQEEAAALFGNDPRIYQTTVKEFIKGDDGNVKKAVTIKLKANNDEKTGRVAMVPVEGSENIIDVDLVLIAAGFIGNEEYVAKAFGVDTDERGNIKTTNEYETSDPNIFVAGDMRRGQSLVVWAIEEGRQAAKAVDKSLIGYTNL